MGPVVAEFRDQHDARAVPISVDDVAADVNVILWSARLHGIRRYFHQRFWEEETTAAKFADLVEPGIKLETVSAHSWHVADIALLLLGHFPFLNRSRCLELALLHDKLEIITGDLNPVGRDGTGSRTHAFSGAARDRKSFVEQRAAELYVERLRPSIREEQHSILIDAINGKSAESRYIKAIDKLQAFAFVLLKKGGDLSDRHIMFTLRYSARIGEYFPGLSGHHVYLKRLFLESIASKRGCSVPQLEWNLFPQLELNL
jgi:putative hydrolase of HD superfamily